MSTIFIDLDCCVFDTIRCICDLYNIDYHNHPRFHEVKADEVNTWEFDELDCATHEDVDKYFSDPRFFTIVQMMNGAKEVIDKLAKKYDITFCSAGTIDNLSQKEEYLRDRFPYANFIGVDITQYPDKSHVNMKNGIFIDDGRLNLETSNAAQKILFGRDFPWNIGWSGSRCFTWQEVESALL